MPWLPEFFSAPVLERIRSQAGAEMPRVPYFDGIRSGETDALLASFAAHPELHHPVRGRVKGRYAFERYVSATNAWLSDSNAAIRNVNTITTARHEIAEAVVTLDGGQGRIELPMALAVDRDSETRIGELRLYYSSWPLTGRHAVRPPVLQPKPDRREPDVVGDYQRALAAGDAEAVVAAFESDAVVREPAGGAYVHRGRDELAALFELFFSNGGGIALEHCLATDDGRACALEYNVVGWGRTELPPQAGIAVYVRGDSGKLACARIYDDCDPPLSP
jgi:hypothetical protein